MNSSHRAFSFAALTLAVAACGARSNLIDALSDAYFELQVRPAEWLSP